MHTKIRNKMRSIGLPLPKSRGALLMELAHEMKVLKEELDECKAGFRVFVIHFKNVYFSNRIFQ